MREEIRSDQLPWLPPGERSIEQMAHLSEREMLRHALNRRFFRESFESHFAIQPEGALYKPHLDRHAGTGDPIPTVIFHLNPDRKPGDGGALKLWPPADKDGAFELIDPARASGSAVPLATSGARSCLPIKPG